jgi:hypothetical protein
MTADFAMAASRAYAALDALNEYDTRRKERRLLRDIDRAPSIDMDDPTLEARLDAAWDRSEEAREKLR